MFGKSEGTEYRRMRIKSTMAKPIVSHQTLLPPLHLRNS